MPFIARWPGKVRAGSVNDDVICLNDLMATLAEILGLKLPADAGEDSVSFLPALLGVSAKPLREATLHQSMAGDLAIRQGPWKAIFFRNSQRELFNLTQDPGKTRNVLAENAEVDTKLTALLQSYLGRGRSTPGERQRNDFEWPLDGQPRPEKQTGKKR